MTEAFSRGGAGVATAAPSRVAVSRSSATSWRHASQSVEVPLEDLPLVVGDGVEHVGTRQRVDIRVHQATPKQSRSRMSPSRSRVLIVPSGVSSSSPTSLYVRPP